MKLAALPSGVSAGAIFPITLVPSSEEKRNERKRKKEFLISMTKAGELCVETKAALASVRNHRLLELENWRGFKMELEKLNFIIEKLTRELQRIHEKRKYH